MSADIVILLIILPWVVAGMIIAGRRVSPYDYDSCLRYVGTNLAYLWLWPIVLLVDYGKRVAR